MNDTDSRLRKDLNNLAALLGYAADDNTRAARETARFGGPNARVDAARASGAARAYRDAADRIVRALNQQQEETP